MTTGATGGIGSAVVRTLAAKGARVVAVGGIRTPVGLVHGELASRNPGCSAISADLRTLEGWRSVIDAAVSTHGRIDVLVHCVGLLVPGAVEDLTTDIIEECLRSNIGSMVTGARAIIPFFRGQGHGHIIIVGSLGGVIPMPYESLYSACKFAARGFTLSVREELRGSGIEVSLVTPGAVRTPMLDLESSCDRSVITFVNRPLQPQRVTDSIVSLIQRPRPEVYLPAGLRRTALVISLFPTVFERIYPVLARFGNRGLRKYRESLAGRLMPKGA